jgi:hypothetical protein
MIIDKELHDITQDHKKQKLPLKIRLNNQQETFFFFFFFKKNFSPSKVKKTHKMHTSKLMFSSNEYSKLSQRKFKIYMRHIENKNTFCLTQAMPKKSIQPMLVSCVLANH